ncbi:hypothetical protein D3C80_1907870 [compost metagenome]
MPRGAIEYLLRIILFVQHIAQIGIVPDFDQIGGGIDPQVQEGRQQHGIDEDAPEQYLCGSAGALHRIAVCQIKDEDWR